MTKLLTILSVATLLAASPASAEEDFDFSVTLETGVTRIVYIQSASYFVSRRDRVAGATRSDSLLASPIIILCQDKEAHTQDLSVRVGPRFYPLDAGQCISFQASHIEFTTNSVDCCGDPVNPGTQSIPEGKEMRIRVKFVQR